MEYILYAVITV